jgi:hypothetical protein
MAETSTPPDEIANLTLRHLRSMRREMAVVLENQVRDRQLILRLTERMDQSFASVAQNFADVRRDIRDLRGDIILLENGLLSRCNDILDLVRRVDEIAPRPAEDGEGR